MSNFKLEEINGSVILPAKELAFIRREFRYAHNDVVEAAYDFLKKFRHTHRYPSRMRWDAAISEALSQPENATPARQLALEVASQMNGPRAPKWSDFAGIYHGKAKVQTNEFPVRNRQGHQIGLVMFNGRELSWHISPIRNGGAEFRRSAFGVLLYRLVQSMVWGRGSGGTETVSCYSSSGELISEGVFSRYGPKGNNSRSAC